MLLIKIKKSNCERSSLRRLLSIFLFLLCSIMHLRFVQTRNECLLLIIDNSLIIFDHSDTRYFNNILPNLSICLSTKILMKNYTITMEYFDYE